MKPPHVYTQFDKRDKVSLNVMLNKKEHHTVFDLVKLDQDVVSEIVV